MELKPATGLIILALAVVVIALFYNYCWNEDINFYRTDTESVLYPQQSQAHALRQMADQQRQPQVIIIERGTGLPQMPWEAPDTVMHVPAPFNPPMPQPAPKTNAPARP